MLITSEIQLFQILKQKLGEKEAEALVEFVDSRLKENNETQSKLLATKEDLANAKVDLIKWQFGFFVALMLMIVGLYFKH